MTATQPGRMVASVRAIGGTISLRTHLDEARSLAEPHQTWSSPAAGRVRSATRWTVYAFLVAFLVAALVGIELWPLTGWRLFSHLRRAQTVSWQAVAVGPSGVEEPIPFGHLPHYGGTLHVFKGFAGLDVAEQDAVCRTWDRALTEVRAGGSQIRIYRVDVDRSIDQRREPGMSRRTLRFVCRDGTVERLGVGS